MRYAVLAAAALAACGPAPQQPQTTPIAPTDAPVAAPSQSQPSGLSATATTEERIAACTDTIAGGGTISRPDARAMCEDAAKIAAEQPRP